MFLPCVTIFINICNLMYISCMHICIQIVNRCMPSNVQYMLRCIFLVMNTPGLSEHSWLYTQSVNFMPRMLIISQYMLRYAQFSVSIGHEYGPNHQFATYCTSTDIRFHKEDSSEVSTKVSLAYSRQYLLLISLYISATS